MSDVRTVRIDGRELAYRTWGEAGAPPLVLAHCLGEDGEDWRGVAGRLATTHQVFAPDLSGHGASTFHGSYSFEGWRDDLAGFVAALDLAPVALVGHSLGALAALLLAADAPETVSRLVLEESPSPLPADPPQQVPQKPSGPLPFDWRAKEAVVAERNAPDPRWWDAVKGVTAPTLVIAGGEGSHLPQDRMAELAARIPDGRLATVEGAGHLVHEERPGEYLDLVCAFLTG
ncbi:alpha/beta fold hydrolase [Streptomyces sp. NPDC059740]|uniref:alpha/beta fold hydrolase n=1 Tax=Streptomyces sp. NPDC059740 TaxID=3346926 RepID=UPI003648F96A